MEKRLAIKVETSIVNRKLNISVITRRILRENKPLIFLFKFPCTQIPNKNWREECFSKKSFEILLVFLYRRNPSEIFVHLCSGFLWSLFKATKRTTSDSYPLLYAASMLNLSNSNWCLRSFLKYFSCQIHNHELNQLFYFSHNRQCLLLSMRTFKFFWKIHVPCNTCKNDHYDR